MKPLANFFDETPQGLRRLVLLLYSVVGPAFFMVMLLLSRRSGRHASSLIAVTALIATAGLWAFFRRNPKTFDWFYPVAISPTVCCGIAFGALHNDGLAFFAVLATPTVWASILFPAPIAIVGWVTATITCFFTVGHGDSYWLAGANTALCAVIVGLVSWVVYKKAHYLRLMTVRQQEQEAKIRESEERFRQLAEIFPETIFEADLNAILTYSNAHGIRKYHWDRQNVDLVSLVHPDDREKVLQRIKDRIAGAAPVGFLEFRALTTTGETFDALAYSAPIIKNGNPVGLRGFILDISERKNIEKKLEQNESFLRLLMENISAGVLVVDLKTCTIEKANKTALDLIGSPAESVIGRHCYNFVCPADKDNCPIIDLGQDVNKSERDLLMADGTRIPIIKSVKKILIGNEEKLLETFLDISEVKTAQAALVESETNFRTFFETISEPILVADLEGKILLANRAVERKLGYTGDAISCLRLPDLFAGDDRSSVGQILLDVLNGSRETCPLPLKTSAGAVVPAETLIWRGKWNGQSCLFAFARDLSAEVEARQLFEWLFRNNPTPMAVAETEKHQFVDVNEAFCASVGYLKSEILGKSSIDLKLFAESQAHIELGKQMWRNGSVRNFPAKIRKRDGSVGEGFFSGTMISMERRKLFLTVMVDISDLKRAETRLLELNQDLASQTARANALAAEAEEANTAKSQFLASMSHEIRTPMNAIIGMACLLLDHDLPAQERHYAEVVRTSAESLLALINEILDLSKIEAGKVTIKESEFDLRELLVSCRMAFEPQARGKGITITDMVDEAVPAAITTDALRLRQILTNLIGNAVKFTDRGGIRITASLDSPWTESLMLRFTVEDSGVGIPKEKQHLLFSRFSQAHSGGGGKFGGTGLGLAISKSLAELMGGAIGVESAAARGATFWFTIKAKKASTSPKPNRVIPSAPRAPESIAFNAAGRDYRILLTEDSMVNQEVAVAILKKLGYTNVIACNNGLEALAILGKEPVDLVLMDMQMPEMDGLEATRVIRDPGSAVQNHLVPIIALTANAMQEDREKCTEAGMNDYLAKPIFPAKLAQMLVRWLPGSAARNRQPADASRPDRKSVFDYDGLYERMLGDTALIDKTLSSFIADFPKRISALKQSIQENDCKMAELHAHNLKGVSATFGLVQVSSIAAEMERAGQLHNLQAVTSAFSELEKLTGEAMIVIKKKLADLSRS